MKNNLEKIQQAGACSDSREVNDVNKSLVQNLRKRMTMVVALTLGALFGGSCDGCNYNVSCGGREVAGCSCVDTGSKGNRLATQRELEKKARDRDKRKLEY